LFIEAGNYAQVGQDGKNSQPALNVSLPLLRREVVARVANNFSCADLEQERTTMKKILTIVAVTTSLIGGANFAFAAATDSRIHTDRNDGCTYQGYSCSDWQQQNGN
jgi:hypothetical protein